MSHPVHPIVAPVPEARLDADRAPERPFDAERRVWCGLNGIVAL